MAAYYVHFDVRARVWPDAVGMERRDMVVSLFLLLQMLLYRAGAMPAVMACYVSLISALPAIVQTREPTAWMSAKEQDEMAALINSLSPLLGICLAHILERTNRLTFAAQVHATRLLSLRIDQLSAEKDRLDYERRMASGRFRSGRTGSRGSGSRSSRSSKRRGPADAPGRVPVAGVPDREETVQGGNLFGDLGASREMLLKYRKQLNQVEGRCCERQADTDQDRASLRRRSVGGCVDEQTG
eukprot:5786137-Prymnesium_polylepis.1